MARKTDARLKKLIEALTEVKEFKKQYRGNNEMCLEALNFAEKWLSDETYKEGREFFKPPQRKAKTKADIP